MGESTEIAWTDHTFNPWHGCARVSPGCEHCYAETFSKRVGHGKRLPMIWGVNAERKFFGDKHWNEPLLWNVNAATRKQRRRVFCASMADVFEDREDLIAPRARLAGLIRATPWLDWLLLTKRPQNASRLWAGAWCDSWNGADSFGFEWAPNIWLGTTVEDQKRADDRIPHLLKVPARVRFLSCEPLLESVTLESIPYHGCRTDVLRGWDGPQHGIHWVIVGGESGGGSRPFNPSWAKDIVTACKAAGVACFVKQMGSNVLDFSRRLSDRKGGDWTEWPTELRVREWPASSAARLQLEPCSAPDSAVAFHDVSGEGNA